MDWTEKSRIYQIDYLNNGFRNLEPFVNDSRLTMMWKEFHTKHFVDGFLLLFMKQTQKYKIIHSQIVGLATAEIKFPNYRWVEN